MKLVVGGLASGKRTYAERLGGASSRMAFDVHERVQGRDIAALADELSRFDVLTCAEVGNGVVPVDASERAWREGVGLLLQELSRRADMVVRMVCGIPVVLKDECLSSGVDLKENQVELVFIRHGQTPGNAARRHVGALDEPLSDGGRRQAQQAGVHPEVPLVYVSKMRRARETARIMFPQARQVVVPGVEEMDFGVFGGRSADEMAGDAAYRTWVDGGCVGRCPQGESRDEFIDRVCAAVERLCREAYARGERRVVLVAHGGTMMASLFRLSDDPRDYYEWLVDNCGSRRAVATVSEDVSFALRVLG